MEKRRITIKNNALEELMDKSISLKILQFGGGNFIRGFADWTFQKLNKETGFNGGVVLLKPTDNGDYKELRIANGKYHTFLKGYKNGILASEIEQIDIIKKIIHPYAEHETFMETAKIPSIRFIVSNTTEAGISFNESNRFEDQPAGEFPGKLTQWLYKRFIHFNGNKLRGCFIIPLELIEDNGESLKKCILQYADHWGLTDAFKNWIRSHNYFCNTIVDRIISGYPDDQDLQKINKNYRKYSQMVSGEIFMSWLIETSQVSKLKKELPLDQLGLNIQFTKNLKPYRDLKVRILNGTHTAMVPVGYLNGSRLVREVMADANTQKFMISLLFSEINPCYKGFPLDEIERYASATLERFRNPNISHKLLDISLNCISKFQIRLWPTIQDYNEKYRGSPKLITFSLACLFKFYEGKTLHGENIALKDSTACIAIFNKMWKRYRAEEMTLGEMVGVLLRDKQVFSVDLTSIENLEEQLVDDLEQILKVPFSKVLQDKLILVGE